MCGSVFGIRIRIQEAPEYGSGSTTLRRYLIPMRGRMRHFLFCLAVCKDYLDTDFAEYPAQLKSVYFITLFN